jgi:Fe2+ transport system protein B
MDNNGTTSIDSLPISPQTIKDNVNLNITENVMVHNPSQDLQKTRKEDLEINQKNLNQFVSGIQQASASGMTVLPYRDIPQNQEQLIQDQQIKPNFIPDNINHQDYILNHQTSEDIVKANAKRKEKVDSLDVLYNELQIPILIGVLYFLFQLPVVRKNMFKYLPMLFTNDGNTNLSGYITNSILFAGLFFLMTKGIRHFSF